MMRDLSRQSRPVFIIERNKAAENALNRDVCNGMPGLLHWSAGTA
jgi:hypothetical protein